MDQRSKGRQCPTKQTEEENARLHAMTHTAEEKAANSLKWNDKGFDDIKSKLGIDDPKGVSRVTLVKTSLTSGACKSNSAIVTGGTKHNYTTITMQDLMENIKESADQTV